MSRTPTAMCETARTAIRPSLEFARILTPGAAACRGRGSGGYDGAPEPRSRAMRMDEMILISVDDHVIEPPTVFENHVPARWAARAPRLVFDARTGQQTWTW